MQQDIDTIDRNTYFMFVDALWYDMMQKSLCISHIPYYPHDMIIL